MDLENLPGLIVFFVAAPVLLQAISEIASQKREAIFSIILTGMQAEGGWEVTMIHFAVAGIVFFALPTWGILKIFFANSVR